MARTSNLSMIVLDVSATSSEPGTVRESPAVYVVSAGLPPTVRDSMSTVRLCMAVSSLDVFVIMANDDVTTDGLMHSGLCRRSCDSEAVAADSVNEEVSAATLTDVRSDR